jgi:transcriptional regulator with XRE-family HTH domain
MTEQKLLEIIADGVRHYRKRLGLTYARLSEAADVDTAFLANIENKKRVPSLGTLAKLITALDVEPEDLFRHGRQQRGEKPPGLGPLDGRLQALLRGMDPKQKADLAAILAKVRPDQIEALRRVVAPARRKPSVRSR